jgi:hypothetical protein
MRNKTGAWLPVGMVLETTFARTLLLGYYNRSGLPIPQLSREVLTRGAYSAGTKTPADDGRRFMVRRGRASDCLPRLGRETDDG